MNKLKQLKLYLLDMDGTIYLDDDLFDGTINFLKYIKSIGGRYIFLTNNSSKSVSKYIEKLNRMGIEADRNDFLTSTDATVALLKKAIIKKYMLSERNCLKNSSGRQSLISLLTQNGYARRGTAMRPTAVLLARCFFGQRVRNPNL